MIKGENSLNEKLRCPVKKVPAAIAAALLIGGGVIAGFAASHIVMSGHGGYLSKTQAGAIVEKLTHHQAKVTRVFHGPSGLTGVVVSGQQGPVIVWVTNSKSAVIVGGVVDAKTNQNLTMQATAKYLLHTGVIDNPADQPHTQPTADSVLSSSAASAPEQPESGESALQQFIRGSQDGSFSEISQPGLSGPHVLYAFVDPNCIFCHRFFDYVQTHLSEFKQEGVRVVYVPVAILKQSSIAKAAAIVDKGWSALLEDEQKFDVNDEEGGIQGLAGTALAQYASPVKVNTTWLGNLSSANHASAGTPFLVWQAGDGRAYYLDGFPAGKGVQALFASMQPGWKAGK
jgi:thiol:disulfide interchange protein DsbG